ncbi:ABC transporter permease [Rhodococcus sp. BP-349]|uniref:ABC transporter permease n=1 Tax=unclassified Rhodococcus (in: high G+C Gram-positive bacteria) TaxID=192944 RepID=UPI001C9A3D01|nr:MULTISPECIES: ABC transporter permease [unclassified Rhodococcus (in: high G+C Gram-positive bacteria)]MBY6539911.1 ABC transporter permease [Rhodococcus sp. BP-363]MBY6543761.1 ABC transporter permease [Rhodococcus sp. BP-369]MBY6562991.1 ABC transporter permease [Rhodococcus sp. BP-370]MBY6577283.1 ABC transporter permease [Rhodococcus sp. BP-364]MBY6586584.1 ABC transporter permease [Rhodococcus sp. BP-358]
MFAFLRRRVYTSLVPLLVVLIGVFFLARLTGDPTSLYLPESATPAQREAFAAQNGFDQSVWAQMADYFGGVLHLDFGESLRTGEAASTMALRAFPATLQLAFVTMLLAVIGSIVIGCWAAYRPNSLADRFSSLLSMTAASIPDFWFAITGVWIFAVVLGVLPTSGTGGAAAWILPIATLLIRPLGVLTQVVRGAMVSALSAPYVRLARSKGAGDLRVVTHHALRNAAAPALTVAGDLTVGLVNGAVVVEAIFGWPGIGKLMIDAILQRDFAVLQAAVLLTAVSIFVLNIVIDACYALLDARVRDKAKV